jgi:hypothetical protein
MHRVELLRAVVAIACCAWASASWGQEAGERTAFSFAEVQAEALRLAELEGGPENVLLVFDIDNTLLAMNQDLCSDQWFNWQQTLAEGDWRRVGNFAELLKVQRVLYAISSMRATEPNRQPEIVEQLQEAGFTTLLLTSRGYDIRDATRRELLANGYDFRQTSMAPRAGFAGPYFPYDVSQIEQSGISRSEAEQWLADPPSSGQIEKPREVSYNEGVCMVAGQNKGMMLRMLLHKSGNTNKYKQILFVDDNPGNTQDMRDAFENQQVNVVTFRYAREDANVRRFNESRCGEKYCASLALIKIKESWATSDVSRKNPPLAPTPRPTPQRQPSTTGP